jgi:hypothetical protein
VLGARITTLGTPTPPEPRRLASSPRTLGIAEPLCSTDRSSWANHSGTSVCVASSANPGDGAAPVDSSYSEATSAYTSQLESRSPANPGGEYPTLSRPLTSRSTSLMHADRSASSLHTMLPGCTSPWVTHAPCNATSASATCMPIVWIAGQRSRGSPIMCSRLRPSACSIAT